MVPFSFDCILRGDSLKHRAQIMTTAPKNVWIKSMYFIADLFLTGSKLGLSSGTSLSTWPASANENQ